MSYGAIDGGSALNGGLPLSTGLAADAQSLGNLKFQAGKNSPEAIKETAKQFESLFMRELIKSMREATSKSGMLDNPGSDLGTDLLDQQFAVQMSGQPGGLSDLIAQQLTRQLNPSADGTVVPANPQPTDPARNVGPIPAAKTPLTHTTPTVNQVEFVNKLSDAATRAEKASGIPASFMLGQAGHETGWGKHEIKVKGGAPSFNLFGIKAGANWTGKVADVTTTEYTNGVATRKVARFRAYDSYEDSFKDYARMINESPRYAQARLQTTSVQAFASGLQKAGYATDPEYAHKLSRAINTTLQLRRVQVQV
jgi:flagellar protein FlgJ